VQAGEAFTSNQREEVARAIRNADTVSGFSFSVFVGASDGETRPFAYRLHAALADPPDSVLLLVDPAARRLEIITGSEVARTLDDADAGLAALSMQTAFAAGDLVGGICTGVQQLGERARRPRSLHTDTP
jgi:uncharacterized membrane protein YgcG